MPSALKPGAPFERCELRATVCPRGRYRCIREAMPISRHWPDHRGGRASCDHSGNHDVRARRDYPFAKSANLWSTLGGSWSWNRFPNKAIRTTRS